MQENYGTILSPIAVPSNFPEFFCRPSPAPPHHPLLPPYLLQKKLSGEAKVFLSPTTALLVTASSIG